MTLPRACRRRLAAHTITLYLAGELSPEAAHAVQDHLVSCPRCARACEDQRLAQRLVRSLTMERPVPAAIDARIQQTLRAGAPRGMGSLRFLLSTRAAARRSGVDRAAVNPRGALPGVALALGTTLLLAVGVASIGGLPSLSLPVRGADSSHSQPTVTVSSVQMGPSSTGNGADNFFTAGGGGRQQLR